MGTVEKVPQSITEDILFKEVLPKLPVSSLLRFKRVSKQWSELISSDPFAADHIRHQTVAGNTSEIIDLYPLKLINNSESNPVELDMSYLTKVPRQSYGEYIMGCSNGLVFLHQTFVTKQKVKPGVTMFSKGLNQVLWNPATRQFRKLPDPIEPYLRPGNTWYHQEHNFGIGFGKDPNNYKILRMAKFQNDNSGFSHLNLQLFTRKSGCWRQLGQIWNATFPTYCGKGQGGLVVGGLMHWVVLQGGDTPGTETGYKILTFDLETEELMEIDGPDGIFVQHHKTFLQLFKWNGCLGLVNSVEQCYIDFWLKSSGDKGWWLWTTTKPCIPESRSFFKCVFRDQFLIVDHGINEHVLYNPITKKITVSEWPSRMNSSNNTHQYIPSLISPSY